MIQSIRKILEEGDGDSLTKISRCFDEIVTRYSGISWLGLYLISTKRNEFLLGPFIGESREPVRFCIEETRGQPGLHEISPDFKPWFQIRDPDFTVDDQTKVVVRNLYRNGQWLGQIEAVGDLDPEDVRIIDVLGSFYESRIPNFDLDDPFSDLS